MELNFLVKYSSDGRITIPREVRKELQLEEPQDLELYVDDIGRIVVTPKAKRCRICNTQDIQEHTIQGKIVYLCNNCVKALREGR